MFGSKDNFKRWNVNLGVMLSEILLAGESLGIQMDNYKNILTMLHRYFTEEMPNSSTHTARAKLTKKIYKYFV